MTSIPEAAENEKSQKIMIFVVFRWFLASWLGQIRQVLIWLGLQQVAGGRQGGPL